MVVRKLHELLPAGVILVMVEETLQEETLLGPEREFIKNAVAKRRFEFLRGRTAARRALKTFNMPPCPIPAGKNREPIWPPGFVGSITHCEGLCAAAVAQETTFRSLGIDAEENRQLTPAIRDQILTEKEKRWYGGNFQDFNVELLIFSAKESLYKCLYPLIKRYIDFLEMAVRIDRGKNTFIAELPGELAVQAGVQTIEGSFSMDESLIFTATYLR